MPAAPKVPLEGQQAAKALSEAYEAVAEFVRPSVVQITRAEEGGQHAPDPGHAEYAAVPGPARRQSPNMNPRDFEEMLKKFLDPEGNPEKEQFGGPGTWASARASSTTITATS